MSNKTKKNTKNENVHNKTKKNQIDCAVDSVLQPFEKIYERQFHGNLTKKNANLENQLVRLFKKSFSPSKFTAQNDYYNWINSQWITQESHKTNEKFYVQLDSFRIVQEKVYYELIELVKKYIQNNKSSRANALSNVYNSFSHLNSSKIQKHVNNVVATIDNYITGGDLYALLANINQNEIVSWGSPIVWTMITDEKHAGIYRNYISPPKLSFYDYEIYIDDPNDPSDKKQFKARFKKRFLEYIGEMFTACFGEKHGLIPNDVLECELDILTSLGCDSIKNEDPNMYNVVKANESLQTVGLDWNKFTSHIGFKEKPEFYICSSLNYLKCIMENLNSVALEQTEQSHTVVLNWQTPKWRTYFIYIYLRQMIRFHHEWRKIYYEFHGKFVQGVPQDWPNEIYPVFGLSMCFNTLLTNEYVEHYEDPRKIAYTKNMAEDLLAVFKRIIRRNTWLTPNTKKQALLKLEHFKWIIGSPKILREDPLLNYDSSDAWGNLEKIAQWRTRQLFGLEGKEKIDIPLIDWEQFKFIGSQAYVVNAYYTPTENSIYVPLGYLQKPFIDLDERGIEYNLAFIGYTLTHEMSHSLDDLGSKYDYQGNLHDWWTDKDRHNFSLKVKDVNEQYETFYAYDGIQLDPTLSTGENMADISGLGICMEYLRDFQQYNKDTVPISMLSFHAFFVYVAVQGRQNIYQKAIKAQLKINPHPMNKYRTNCPLARLKLFQSLYNIQKLDKMYWSSTDTIW